MRSTEFLNRFRADMAAVEAQLLEVAGSLSVEELNRSHGQGEWTTGQIFRHMALANGPYLAAMAASLDGAQPGDDADIRHTWFARMLLGAMRPGKSAPAPKRLHPEPGPYTAEVIEAWQGQNRELAALADRAEGIPIGAIRFRNPYMPLVRMCLADAFAITLAHTEYHARQIVARHGGSA